MNNCIWIGIGINISPNDPEYEQLFSLNRLLVKECKSTYFFDPVLNQPHINLYDLDIPEENLSDVETVLQQIAENFKNLVIHLDGVSYFKHGTIFINCKLDDQLNNLEKQIVESISPLKGSCRTQDYWQPWRDYSPQQIENREKYGNPHVLNTFVPHLTIGYVKAGEDELQKIVKKAESKLTIKYIDCRHIDLVVHDKEGQLLHSNRLLFKP